MSDALKDLAIRLRDVQREHKCDRDQAITRVYLAMLEECDHWDVWQNLGKWVLRQVDYRTPHILGVVKSQARVGEPWMAKKSEPWFTIEARVGGSRGRKPWGEVTRQDLEFMADTRTQTAAKILYDAETIQEIIKHMPAPDTTTKDVFDKLPGNLQAWMWEHITGQESTKEEAVS